MRASSRFGNIPRGAAARPARWGTRLALVLAAAALGLSDESIGARSAPGAEVPRAVALIVNPHNTAPDPSLAELRDILNLERQFWPDGRRVVLFLPPSNSPQKDILLQHVYAMSDAELRRFWVAKLFRGAIPSIPSTLRTSEAVRAAVQSSEGALAVVLASEVPPGVRVLKIDGKAPGDTRYPLVAADGAP